MKFIKVMGICVLAFVLVAGLGSCSSDEYETRIHELLINKNYTFVADEESGNLRTTITLRNEDLSNYSISSDATWCKAEIDANASTITITVNENDTYSERVATVTIKDVIDGLSSRSFTVTQEQNDAVLLPDGTRSYDIGTDGGKITVNIDHNIDYTVKIDDADWITVSNPSGTRALVRSQVVFEVAKNLTQMARSATVYIIPSSGAQIPLLIKQEFSGRLQLKDSSGKLTTKPIDYVLDEHGGDIELYVVTNANASYDCYTEYEDTWVKKSNNREIINDTTILQVISIDPLTEKMANRTSTVSIQNARFNKECTVNIIQRRDMYIKEESVEILIGDTRELTLHNLNYDEINWKSNNPSVVTVDDDGILSGVGVGDDVVVTATTTDGLHTDQVLVTVRMPEDLGKYIGNEWLPSYTLQNGKRILSRLVCRVTNNSPLNLKAYFPTFYCDNRVIDSGITYESRDSLRKGDVWDISIDIPMEREKSDTIYSEEDPTVIESIVLGEYKANTHRYSMLWNYSYRDEIFSFKRDYQAEDPDASSAAAARRRSAARRGRASGR